MNTSELNSQEREIRIGQWVNEIPYQVTTFRLQFIIFAPKGHDARSRFRAGQFNNSITVQTGAIDHGASRKGTTGSFHYCSAAVDTETRP